MVFIHIVVVVITGECTPFNCVADTHLHMLQLKSPLAPEIKYIIFDYIEDIEEQKE